MKKLLAILLACALLFTACNTKQIEEFKSLENDEREFLKLNTEEQLKVVGKIANSVIKTAENSKETEYYKNNKDEITKSIDETIKSVRDELSNPKKMLEGIKDGMDEKVKVQTILDSFKLINLKRDLRKFSQLTHDELNEIYSSMLNYVKEIESHEKRLDIEKISDKIKSELNNKEYKDMEVFKVFEKIFEKIHDEIADKIK